MNRALGSVAGAVLAVIATTATGCGSNSGSDAGGTCGRVEPCGGDVVGSWTTVGSCVDTTSTLTMLASQLGLACPAGTRISMARTTAARDITASFALDGTYTGTSAFSGELDVDIPSACLGGGLCSDLDAALRAMVTGGAIVAAGCSGGDTCACSISEGGTFPESGTYSTSVHTLDTVPAGQTVVHTDYCVAGSQLHFINLDPLENDGPMGQPTIASDIVLDPR